MNSSIRYELLVADVTSYLTAEHQLASALQRILDQAVLGLEAATGSLLMRPDASVGAQLIALSGGGPLTDVLHLNTSAGPAADCAASASIVLVDDLQQDPRWPAMSKLAQQADLRSARAYPVRLANQAIGALTLYSQDRWGTQRPSHLGQTMADLAAVAIGLEPVRAKQESIAERIRELITDRVAVNQASGMVAQHLNIDVAQAHSTLIARADQEGKPPATLAVELINDRDVLRRF